MTTTATVSKNADHIIGSIAKGFADLTVGFLADMAAEHNRKQEADKQAKKEACVALIDQALTSGKRVSKQKLFDIIPSLAYCNNRHEIARKLGITVSEYNAAVKRWYHIF